MAGESGDSPWHLLPCDSHLSVKHTQAHTSAPHTHMHVQYTCTCCMHTHGHSHMHTHVPTQYIHAHVPHPTQAHGHADCLYIARMLLRAHRMWPCGVMLRGTWPTLHFHGEEKLSPAQGIPRATEPGTEPSSDLCMSPDLPCFQESGVSEKRVGETRRVPQEPLVQRELQSHCLKPRRFVVRAESRTKPGPDLWMVFPGA